MSGFKEHEHPRAAAGTFTDKQQGKPELSLARSTYADMEPSDIDGELVGHYQELHRWTSQVHNAEQLIEKVTAEEDEFARTGVRKHRWAVTPEQQIASAQKRIDDAQAPIEAARALIAPITAEFNSRGGWTRYFVTTGSDPHVHNTRSCSTCRPTTEFGWLTDQSGMSEDELVELAGDEACTVCMPSAPVVDKRAPRASRLETPAAREARVEREQAAAERAAKKAAAGITSAEGEDLGGTWGSVFKTERAAEVAAVGGLFDMAWYGNHPDEESWAIQAANVEDAISHKRGITVDDLRATWRKKLIAKGKRDGGLDRLRAQEERIFRVVDEVKKERTAVAERWEELASKSHLTPDEEGELATTDRRLRTLRSQRSGRNDR
ncbi:hypothetical protein [Frigoribacterium sp. SL97]|uniref:hypothetical protein n=1 Tax=Frigoribacterium sp. SL97 TaxID=2994664 RepID=UPI0022715289|nr:hypothetical protein [Frigoribacterium sp. SL97]WAC50243.1 hypothetical protein OVA02_10110 [Frigoribacterium sp. SL97]